MRAFLDFKEAQQWFQSDYWDAAVSSGPNLNQWGYKLIGNSVHDSYGECADVLVVNEATVQGDRIYNCVSTNLFVSNSRNVTVDRNWIYADTDKYNRRDYGTRATGVLLANEGRDVGSSLSGIRITNNVIEWVTQGLRYWRSSHSGAAVKDTYGSLYVGFNNLNRTTAGPIHFDTPEGWSPSASSRFRRNLVLNPTSYSWFSTDQWSSWDVTGNWNYGARTTSSGPGIIASPEARTIGTPRGRSTELDRDPFTVPPDLAPPIQHSKASSLPPTSVMVALPDRNVSVNEPTPPRVTDREDGHDLLMRRHSTPMSLSSSPPPSPEEISEHAELRRRSVLSRRGCRLPPRSRFPRRD